MFSSLRGRLLAWYGSLVAVVIVVFGLMVGYLAWRSRVADVDAQLRVRAELLGYALEPAAAGTFDLRLPAVLQSEDELYHAVWADSGALIDRSNPEVELPSSLEPGTSTRDGRREHVRRGASGGTILVGRSLAPAYAEVRSLLWMMSGVGAVALGVSLIGGWLLVGRALTPIDRIGRTARAMVAGDLSARIPVDRVETELGSLATALNDAFQRLHEALERQRRFTADASHELRTPLATISTEVHWALSHEREASEYRRSLQTCRRAATRMQGVVERLLALARAEAPVAPLRLNPVRVDELVRQVAKDLEPLSTARRINVAIDAAPATIMGDADVLFDAVTQVVANAIQYNVDAGAVRIEVREAGGEVRVAVADTGVGIAAEDLPRVFEPFFRADPARQRQAGGAGLGLAVTRAIVVRHGGDITCESALGQGTTFTFRLRAASG
jgi:signal transduction histidine kinase